MRIADPHAYPPALEQAEASLVAARRDAAAGPDGRGADGRLPHDTTGFGLSGGGVRSATFCLGLFQALAHSHTIRRIDFLSTVSGGGYFGAFLGRLFMRPWIRGVDDVERVLLGDDPVGQPPARTGWGAQVFRWLRENGRYLAPRGSGDLLVLGSVLLRNWVSVQIVLATTTLTGLVCLQLLRTGVDRLLSGRAAAALGPAADWLRWSPWLALPVVPFTFMAVPAAWAYWMVARGQERVAARAGAALAAGLSCAGLAYYGWVHPEPLHRVRLAVCLTVAIAAVFTLAIYIAARRASAARHPTAEESDDATRMRLSHTLARGIVLTGAAFALGAVDTAGQSIYLAWSTGGILSLATGVLAAFAAVGALARPLALLLGWGRGPFTPRVSLSVVSWVAAGVVLAVWLITIDVAAHAIRLGVRTGLAPTGDPGFLLAACIVLAAFTLLFGRTRTFANLSSAQGLYAARLIRTFLGASNDARLTAASPVWETTAGDDCHGRDYWLWPDGAASASRPEPRPWDRGAPLHLINVTVNETVDARTGIQSQDRKGTGLATGPCGLSLGIRHHLVTGGLRYPAGPREHHVFLPDGAPPEPLTLGRWASISGAAYSTAAGSNTSVPVAILCALFNVRLGYWWDSGQPPKRRRLFERLLPVQAALFDEMCARTHGTAGRLWNLSDGGHFENMGGYELIRRRLPLIVIVDAEADPEYAFNGLADLIRKARLDFGAEVRFLRTDELDAALHPSVRAAFGHIDAVRRTPATGAFPPGVSHAHAALAWVRYGDATDAGSWLVYVKASMTGDEPEDVRQFQRAHADFPQETTFDQFFDEAQWESYRRLGQHIGEQALAPELFDGLLANVEGPGRA